MEFGIYVAQNFRIERSGPPVVSEKYDRDSSPEIVQLQPAAAHSVHDRRIVNAFHRDTFLSAPREEICVSGCAIWVTCTNGTARKANSISL